jgi:hypothetical protein
VEVTSQQDRFELLRRKMKHCSSDARYVYLYQAS